MFNMAYNMVTFFSLETSCDCVDTKKMRVADGLLLTVNVDYFYA